MDGQTNERTNNLLFSYKYKIIEHFRYIAYAITRTLHLHIISQILDTTIRYTIKALNVVYIHYITKTVYTASVITQKLNTTLRTLYYTAIKHLYAKTEVVFRVKRYQVN